VPIVPMSLGIPRAKEICGPARPWIASLKKHTELENIYTGLEKKNSHNIRKVPYRYSTVLFGRISFHLVALSCLQDLCYTKIRT